MLSQNKKSIFLIVNSYHYIENFKKNFVRLLLKDEYLVTIIILNNKKKNLKKIGQEKHFYIKKNFLTPFNDIFQIIKLLLKNNISSKDSIVISYTTKANIIVGISRVIIKFKWIMGVSGIGTLAIRKNKIYQVGYFLYRNFSKFSDYLIFQNKDDLKEFFYSFKSNKKYSIIPGSGVDFKKFSYQKYKKKEKFVFLMASRLIHDKGIFEYLEASKIFLNKFPQSNVEFWLAGFALNSNPSSLTRIEIKNLCKKNGVLFLDNIKNDKMNELLKNIDVFVLPSYREGLPKSVIESFAIGRPAILTNVAGCRDLIIKNFNGWLCEPHSIDSLFKTFVNVFNTDRKIIQKYGKNAYNFAIKKFDVNFIDISTLKIVKKILKKNGSNYK